MVTPRLWGSVASLSALGPPVIAAPPPEAAARWASSEGWSVLVLALEGAGGEAAGRPEGAGPVEARTFAGDAAALDQALQAALRAAPPDRIVVGPLLGAAMLSAARAAPTRTVVWPGAGLRGVLSEATAEAFHAALSGARGAIYLDAAEKSLVLRRFAHLLDRPKIEAAPCGPLIAPFAAAAAADGPGPRPLGVNAHLVAVVSEDVDAEALAWFPRLRDALAFESGPLDLHLLPDSPAAQRVTRRLAEDMVGVRSGPLETAEKHAARIVGARALISAAGPWSEAALWARWRAWAAGAPVIELRFGAAGFASGGGVGPPPTGDAALPVDSDAALAATVLALASDEPRAASARAGRAFAALSAEPARCAEALCAALAV